MPIWVNPFSLCHHLTLASFFSFRLTNEKKFFFLFYTGTTPDHPTYVAIKGSVFDVTGNPAYAPGGAYHGKERSSLLLFRFVFLFVLKVSFFSLFGKFLA